MSSFTTFWPKDWCDRAQKLGLVGSRLSLLFGGPHQSEPSFMRACVKPGDIVYPIRVLQGVVYLVAGIAVTEIVTLDEYVHTHSGLFTLCPAVSGIPGGKFGGWLRNNPQFAFLAPTCTDEVVVGDGTLSIGFDRPIPSGVLTQLRFRSQRAERGLNHIVDGRLTSIVGLQGIYRLTDESAELIESSCIGLTEDQP